jgi:uncharacterized hydrophobic protein (TIGR00271 family)
MQMQQNLSITSQIKSFLKDLMNIKNEVDFAHAKERIEAGVYFRGFNVWVLICSIFIASIGLNANSTAVIIGAMLISPLMGPIVGAGFAVGTHDFQLLKKALTNFSVMVGISLFTSFLYFLLTPIGKAGTEILARTEPNLLDIFIAFFGGLAGIIATTRRGISNAIPGVAIATALMPPLCTAGYGLSSGQWGIFLGALYLFLLNCVFICLSTWLFVRSVGFTGVTLINKVKERRIRSYILLFVFLCAVPSFYAFYTLIVKSKFEHQAEQFSEQIAQYPESYIIRKEIQYDHQHPQLILSFTGKKIPQTLIESWKMAWQKRFPNAELWVIQNESLQDVLHAEKLDSPLLEIILQDKYKELDRLKKQNDSLQKALQAVYFSQSDEISLEAETLFPEIKDLAYAHFIHAKDTIPLVFVSWHANLSAINKATQEEKLQAWLRVRQKNKHIQTSNFFPSQK